MNIFILGKDINFLLGLQAKLGNCGISSEADSRTDDLPALKNKAKSLLPEFIVFDLDGINDKANFLKEFKEDEHLGNMKCFVFETPNPDSESTKLMADYYIPKKESYLDNFVARYKKFFDKD